MLKKKEAAVETALSIEEQTRAFLESGGKVETVDAGISGQPSMAAPKQFTIDNKPKS